MVHLSPSDSGLQFSVPPTGLAGVTEGHDPPEKKPIKLYINLGHLSLSDNKQIIIRVTGTIETHEPHKSTIISMVPILLQQMCISTISKCFFCDDQGKIFTNTKPNIMLADQTKYNLQYSQIQKRSQSSAEGYTFLNVR